MAYVIAEPCIGACHSKCVEVCPVDCIQGPIPVEELRALPPPERPPHVQMYIDPEACTSCGACAAECPAEAIFDEDELPAEWAGYKERNARFFADLDRTRT